MILVFLLLPIILFVSCLIRAVTVSILWKWFIVSTFSLPPLAPLQALGLSLFIAYLFNTSTVKKNENEDGLEAIRTALGEMIIAPLIFLAMGYVIKSFM